MNTEMLRQLYEDLGDNPETIELIDAFGEHLVNLWAVSGYKKYIKGKLKEKKERVTEKAINERLQSMSDQQIDLLKQEIAGKLQNIS
jgi:hypothetical protein